MVNPFNRDRRRMDATAAVIKSAERGPKKRKAETIGGRLLALVSAFRFPAFRVSPSPQSRNATGDSHLMTIFPLAKESSRTKTRRDPRAAARARPLLPGYRWCSKIAAGLFGC